MAEQGPTIPDLNKKVEFDVESIILKKSRGENDVVQHLMAYSRQDVININNVCWN